MPQTKNNVLNDKRCKSKQGLQTASRQSHYNIYITDWRGSINIILVISLRSLHLYGRTYKLWLAFISSLERWGVMEAAAVFMLPGSDMMDCVKLEMMSLVLELVKIWD